MQTYRCWKCALYYRTRFAFTYTAFHDIGKIFIYIVKNKVFWDYFYFHQQLYLYANIPSWKIHANFFLNKKKIISDQMTNTVINNLMVFIHPKTKRLFLRRRRQLLTKFRSSVSTSAIVFCRFWFIWRAFNNWRSLMNFTYFSCSFCDFKKKIMKMPLADWDNKHFIYEKYL